MRWWLVFGLCWVASSLQAQEWARFRGPNGSGVSMANLPIKWTDKDYLWKVPIPGRGYSSPIVWQDQIFVTSALEKAGQRIVLCIDAGSGKILWRRDFTSSPYKLHKRNSSATSTPTVDQERLYLAWVTPQQYLVQALDRRTGKDVWSVDLGPYASQHGFGVSLILHDTLLILPNDQDKKGSLLALDTATGKKVWDVPRHSGNTTYSTPCIYQPSTQPASIVFTNWQHGITAIDPATGKVRWETSVFEPKKSERAIASPIIAGDLVIGTCGFVTAQKHFVAVRADEQGQVKEVWRMEKAVAYMPTPVVKDGKIYSCTELGILSCIDAATGKLVWQERLDGSFSASPICASQAIYCVNNEGEVFVLEAGAQYKLLARNSLHEPTQCTPAIAGDRLILRTNEHLLAIGGLK